LIRYLKVEKVSALSLGMATLAKMFKAVDLKLMRKVRDVPVVNPIPEKIFEDYNRWLKERLGL